MHPTDLLLNEYIDDALTPGERGNVDDHLRGCDRCRAAVADVRELRRVAASLRPMEPPARTWTHIERALRQSTVDSQQSSVNSRQSTVVGRQSTVVGRERLVTGRWRPATLAAAAALILGTIVGLRFMTWRDAAQPQGATAAPTAQSIEAELRQAEEHYQKAISGLEQIANADKGALDPNTAATLQKNLAVVDQAISESRAALRTQPNSEPAQASLLESFRAKITLLQDTVALINEMRKGNEAGAAQIVSGLKRGT
jgi:anti-sigma factor RsiW